jgi:multicomponent Na+:H+ antiporter subunit G
MSEIVKFLHYPGYGFIVLGILFDFFGCLGLIRLPDLYNRLQAATKCVTMGTCSIMFGVLLITGFSPQGMKALFVIIFLILTAPTSAHALARAAHIAGVRLWEKSVCDYYREDKVLNPPEPKAEEVLPTSHPKDEE